MKLDKTQKVFLCFSWTGEDHVVVERRMNGIEKILRDGGIDAYCNLTDPLIKDFTKPGQFISHAFEKIRGKDVLVIVKSSSGRSEGQLMEIGAALFSGIPIITLIKSGLESETYIHDSDISKAAIFWDNEEDLMEKVKGLL